MKGFQISSGLCLIIISLVSLQTQLASAGYSMSETCTYISEGYIANPADCQSYGYCSNGALLGTRSCGAGLLFDTTTGGCNFADKVKCATKLESTCKYTDSPMYLPNPDDCTQACYCNEKGKYTCTACPKGQVFNPTSRACVWGADYSCPADSVCRLVPNNVFAADPNKCGNYLACFSGSGVSTPCDPGNWFNPLTGVCANENICAGNAVPNTPGVGPGIQTALPSLAAKCATYPPGFTDLYYIADGQTCFGYYVCSSNAGPGQWLKCPMGTHFNQDLQKCVTPYTFKCQYDRCGNIGQSFVSTLGCDSYLYCINQTSVPDAGNTCSILNPEFPWFDEYLGSCVNVEPTYAICSP